jgi:hypothetical protein
MKSNYANREKINQSKFTLPKVLRYLEDPTTNTIKRWSGSEFTKKLGPQNKN